MQYANMVPGIFLARPNRFIAHIEIDGQKETVHVKNTGRCRELLPVGARVWCQRSDNSARKTKYDLIAVQKGSRLINMDSQAPNLAAKEWLAGGGLGEIQNLRAETKHGDSRFDFSFTKDGKAHTLSFGIGENLKTEFSLGMRTHLTCMGKNEEGAFDTWASGAWTEENKFSIKAQIIDNYFGQIVVHLFFKGDDLSMVIRKSGQYVLDGFAGYAIGHKEK